MSGSQDGSAVLSHLIKQHSSLFRTFFRSLALWSLHKKKPAAFVPNAHGRSHFWTRKGPSKDNRKNGSRHDVDSGRLFRALTGASTQTVNSKKSEEMSGSTNCVEAWVTALAAIPNSDFIASGE